jgi:hypothetical protein
LGRRGREVGRPDLDTEAVIEPGARKEGTVAFSTCDHGGGYGPSVSRQPSYTVSAGNFLVRPGRNTRTGTL